MFRRQEGYHRRKIGEAEYLLPYGQKIADQKKAMKLNETALVLWEFLEEPQTLSELCRGIAEYYQISPETEELDLDIETFINEMVNFGAVRKEIRQEKGTYDMLFKIAGIKMGIRGREELIPQQFAAFEIESKGKPADLEICLLEQPPVSHQNGTILIRNKELHVSVWEDGLIFLFPTLENIYEVRMNQAADCAEVYCRAPGREEEKNNLFLCIRPLFLFLAQRRGMFAIHSASLLYHKKAWLFSGHSGMGKSTHTGMWNELLNTPLLNGDLNLCGEKDGKIFVFGIPWCGTSEIFTEKTYELGGIVLLEKAQEDQIIVLSQEEKALRVMQRMISPSWTAEWMLENLKFAEMMAEKNPVFHLRCTKEFSAVYKIKEQIDRCREAEE